MATEGGVPALLQHKRESGGVQTNGTGEAIDGPATRVRLYCGGGPPSGPRESLRPIHPA